MDYEHILFSASPPLGTITLNNPRKINSLSKQMVAELQHALVRMGGDSRVKVVILNAAGKHFCAGHDLSEMTECTLQEYQSIFNGCTRMMQMIHQIPQPVIAQIQGIATAAGCQLAAWCDLAVAEEGARFATPGVKIGLFCSTPMVALTRAIGRKAAMEMLLTGRYVPALEAKALGLVNHVVPLDRLEEKTRELAEQIATASAMVLGFGKQTFYAQIDQADDPAWEHAKQAMTVNSMAEDAQIGMAAFLNKTEPIWVDR